MHKSKEKEIAIETSAHKPKGYWYKGKFYPYMKEIEEKKPVSHENSSSTNMKDSLMKSTPSIAPILSRPAVLKPTSKLLNGSSLDSKNSSNDFSFQKNEISLLKIRYPSLKIIQDRELIPTSEYVFDLDLPITDPDFPYDLENIHLQIKLALNYPFSALPMIIINDKNIPYSMTKKIQYYLDKEVILWSQEQSVLLNKDPYLRELLAFIDSKIEQWISSKDPFDVGSGIKLIPPDKNKVVLTPMAVSTNRNLESSNNQEETVIERLAGLDMKSETTNKFSEAKIKSGIMVQPIEPKLINIALLKPVVLNFRAVCHKCQRSFTPIPGLFSSGMSVICRNFTCPHCRSNIEGLYQYGAIFPGGRENDGTVLIRIQGLTVVDLLPSDYQITCGKCLPETDDTVGINETVLKGVGRGSTQYFNCRYCQASLGFSISDIKFTPFPKSESVLPLKKTIKAKGGFIIIPGKSLPEHGACKHYKKSYRWLRFPCCGQTYPCDTCHEEGMDSDGNLHQTQWANRMICGYCSKEQTFSQNPCVSCGKVLSTIGQRKSAHWEGGKGTRNTVTMSRKDSKKYKK